MTTPNTTNAAREAGQTEIETRYRVYRAPDGCAPEYVGVYDTLEEARTVAQSEPRGLPQSLWGTALAAGHCNGMTAPEPASQGWIEDDEPEGWYGSQRLHCVTPVTHREEEE